MTHDQQYDILDDLLALKERYATLDEDTRARLKAHVILNSADHRAVTEAADISGDDWAHIYPPTERPRVSTTAAIDTFLETYGHASPEEDALLERLIFNPTPDYAGVLEAREPIQDGVAPSADDLTLSRIDSFMSAHQKRPSEARTDTPSAPVVTAADSDGAAPAATDNHTSAAPDAPTTEKTPAARGKAAVPMPTGADITSPQASSLSESLAKIYIRQGRYRRAFEIISDLNLKYPEKSVYFADQLRFLKKLMLIEDRMKQQ